MATLHITNLTGSPLPFTCSSPTESQWTYVDHENNVTTFVSGKGNRPRVYLFARSSVPSPGPVDEKISAKPVTHFPLAWVFTIQRPLLP
ncbi:hypothetical protein OPQ81_007202 [Rhizoctonia solani]|nr:hypothetical protein OPQ81_007202 [Rhizoctonia solani]